MLPGIASSPGLLGSQGGSGGTATDPHFSNVVLLCGFEGANGDVIMTDESPSAHGNASVASNAQISTTQKRFGNTSLKLLAGSSDFITWPDSTDWPVGTGQFTVEFFFYPSGISGVQSLIGQWGTGSNKSWSIQMNNQFVNWQYTANGSTVISPINLGTVSANTWNHAAVDFDGTTHRGYINGVRTQSDTGTENLFNSTDVLRIGGDSAGGNYFNGYIDEVRITKGVARYATNSSFTVPTAAFPRS